MNKPDWADAPEWAHWLATDKDGQYSWWNIKPRDFAGFWSQGYDGQEYMYQDLGEEGEYTDLTQTLEQRP